MKHKKASIILISIGVLFLLNAIFGRYLVLPGYLAGFIAGHHLILASSKRSEI